MGVIRVKHTGKYTGRAHLVRCGHTLALGRSHGFPRIQFARAKDRRTVIGLMRFSTYPTAVEPLQSACRKQSWCVHLPSSPQLPSPAPSRRVVANESTRACTLPRADTRPSAAKRGGGGPVSSALGSLHAMQRPHVRFVGSHAFLRSHIPQGPTGAEAPGGEVPRSLERWRSRVAPIGFDKYYYRKH